jgi:hypothetical protein
VARRIKATQVRASTLQLGDCFSFYLPDRWEDMHLAILQSVGERVHVLMQDAYVRGYGKVSAGEGDMLVTKIEVVEDDEAGGVWVDLSSRYQFVDDTEEKE